MYFSMLCTSVHLTRFVRNKQGLSCNLILLSLAFLEILITYKHGILWSLLCMIIIIPGQGNRLEQNGPGQESLRTSFVYVG